MFWKIAKQVMISITRMFIVGLLAVLFVIFNVDQFLNPDRGTDNITFIFGSFFCVPLFAAVFTEFLFFFRRKNKLERISQKRLTQNKI